MSLRIVVTVGALGLATSCVAQHRNIRDGTRQPVVPLPVRPEHVIVVGAGVVGVTTAYALARRGCAVTLVEQAPDVAVGCSFANAGGIRYSKFHTPMAHPGMPRRMSAYVLARARSMGDASSKLKGISQEHQPLQFFSVGMSSWLDPVFYVWGARFLHHCWFTPLAPRCQALDALALHSVALLERTVCEEGMESEVQLQRVGSLNVFRRPEDFQHAIGSAQRAAERGMRQPVRFLTHAQAIELEPWLARFTPCAGAVYNVNDLSGDCRKFVLGLARRCVEKLNVRLHLNTAVTRTEERGDKVVVHLEPVGQAAEQGQGQAAPRQLEADALVVCTGSDTADVMRPLGVHMASTIYPMRGYSFTGPPLDPATAPKRVVSDLESELYVSSMSGNVRVCSMGEFNGRGANPTPSLVERMQRAVQRELGHVVDVDAAQVWMGRRPITVDGMPIVSQVPGHPRIFVNAGHASEGWKFSHGTADAISRMVVGEPLPAWYSHVFSLHRFWI